jgi:hypothetical protein
MHSFQRKVRHPPNLTGSRGDCLQARPPSHPSPWRESPRCHRPISTRLNEVRAYRSRLDSARGSRPGRALETRIEAARVRPRNRCLEPRSARSARHDPRATTRQRQCLAAPWAPNQPTRSECTPTLPFGLAALHHSTVQALPRPREIPARPPQLSARFCGFSEGALLANSVQRTRRAA